MADAALKLASSMATRELLAALVAEFQQDTGQVVTAEAAGGVEVARRVEQGEQIDVVVLASSAIDKLVQAGRVLAGSRVDLVQSGIAIAVNPKAAWADKITVAELKAIWGPDAQGKVAYTGTGADQDIDAALRRVAAR